MPYSTTNDLPDSVRDNLPKHAQDIYKEAFNNAFKEYGNNEQLAHRVAWSAVKKRYEKSDGGWHEKS